MSKTGHHIITSPGHPWGWDATLQDYDGDNLIGRGPTELVAIADLIDQLRDQEHEAVRERIMAEMPFDFEAMTPELDPAHPNTPSACASRPTWSASGSAKKAKRSPFRSTGSTHQ